MMKGNEKDCICEKTDGKHRKSCDAFRLAEFMARCSARDIKFEKFKKLLS